jgi:hypothetical protein
MKAILVREFGGPGVVELEEVPAPLPAAFDSGKMFPRVASRAQTEILEPETERIANEDQRLDSS